MPGADDLPGLDAARTFLEKSRRAYECDPLFHRFVRWRANSSASNTQPWHALAERSYMAWTAAGNHYAWQLGPGRFPHDEQTIALNAAYVACISRAQVFLWTSEAARLCQAMPDLPRHVIGREILKYPNMYFSLEADTPVSEHQDTTGILVSEAPNGVVMVNDAISGDNDKYPPCFWQGLMPFGLTYPDDFKAGTERQAAAQLLKRLAFLDSKAAQVDHLRMPRGLRRGLAREGADEQGLEEKVGVVRLRASPRGAEPRGAEEGGTTDWKHHWWVRGHWRAQWYASEKAHRVIWVAPFVKGDHDKPLLQKVYIVDR